MLTRLSLSSSKSCALGLLGALALAGCVEAPATPDETVVPRLTANALTPTALYNATLTTVQLDATSAAAMAATSDARDVLQYAVSCALGATQSITFTVAGASYTYAGSLGLATGWTTGALSTTSAAWLSACLFSRVNLTGTSVSISDRGALTALDSTAPELVSWDLEEGAFWGNAFSDLGPIAPYACDGIDQAADDTVGDLPDRQCAQPDGASPYTPCGMTYAGLCTAACSTASPYAGCRYNGGTASSTVITAFVLGP